MKLTALSLSLVAALGMSAGCSTQNSMSQARPAATSADAQYALGRYYQGQQRYELAIDAYRRALEANPAHAGAHNGLGASLLLAGRNAEAIEQFKTGLRHQPASAPLWNNLGYAYALGGEHGLAEMAYKQSLNLDPADARTATNLAAVRQAAQPAVAAAAAPVQPVAVAQTRVAVVYPSPAVSVPVAAAESVPAQPETAPAIASPRQDEPVATPAAVAAVPAEAQADSPAPAATTAAPAAPSVKVVEVAPRVYEMKLRDTNAHAPIATPAAVAGTARLSIPLRDAAIQMASINPGDFMLEIRNGNGVRHLALRTSRYLADHGYTTRHLSNQRGFNVKVTRIFYLPGYMEQATQLLAHLPRDTVLTETRNLRRGTHVRVVLGKDMVQHQAALDTAREKIQLAALQP